MSNENKKKVLIAGCGKPISCNSLALYEQSPIFAEPVESIKIFLNKQDKGKKSTAKSAIKSQNKKFKKK